MRSNCTCRLNGGRESTLFSIQGRLLLFVMVMCPLCHRGQASHKCKNDTGVYVELCALLVQQLCFMYCPVLFVFGYRAPAGAV